ncbi:uncharacterized protein CcaverHIS019_0309110 [Cutaneotrichosporon cavernicola]|uniref:Galactose oxidase n=1 Tax=Cutaneotrichosporon cavernicola TaxID=279322 RepID=A0AA48IFW2_9TREE|nr:uncharacterized protein CcaverHIS019_0309110 [Cutaneotrichosporon cavernicola]BEI90841.1 hypothetical protein CcaverHIS019_0309110 [Cutaneotrichosporon cavernicola]
MIPRWGAAVAVLSQPPTVVIQGGKTDPSGQFSYSSAPNSGDTVVLPLMASFPTSNPPYSLFPNGPSYAWHCLAPLFSKDGEWTLLSFGGDGGWASPISDVRSAHLLTLNPTTGTMNYTQLPEGLGAQPSRRVRHSCAAPASGGKVYITGGQETDYSETFAQTFVFDPESMSFSPLVHLPAAIYGHSSVLLSNGTLLVMGGVTSQSGAIALQPLDTLYALDTTSSSATWESINVPAAPVARRSAFATLNPDGSVFVFGGADAEGKPLNDGWILDPQHLSWTQTFDGGNGVLGRYDHVAATGGGGQVIVFGGYGKSAPVPPDTIIINSRAAPVGMHASGSTSGENVLTAGTGVGSPTPTSTDSSSPIGAAPSIAPLTLGLTVGLIGGVLLLGFALLMFWWCLRRRRRAKKNEEDRQNLIQDDMEKGALEKGAVLRNSPRDRGHPSPQRQKSLLQRLGTKIWRRPAYVPLGGEPYRKPTIFAAETRDHFQPQPLLPFQGENSLPLPPKPYNPDDIVFSHERDMGVRGVPGCLSRNPRSAVSGEAVVASAVNGLATRPSYRPQRTAELSNITPFPYTAPAPEPIAPTVVVIGGETAKATHEMYESDAHLSDAYDADESSAGHRILERPLPHPPAEPSQVYVYPPLSATSSASSARSHGSDAYTSEASRGVPAVAQLIGVAGGLSGATMARASSKRISGKRVSGRKQTAPWDAWDPKSDTESSAYHYPLGPKMGTTVYDPAGNRLGSALHARTYSNPFTDTDDDAPLLLPPKENLGVPFPALALSSQALLQAKPLPLPQAHPQPVSVKTVPSARETSQEADITSVHFGPRPMPASPPPPLPLKSLMCAELGAELEVHRLSAVESMRSAASHSSVFGALGERDLDLSFDFIPPVAVPSPPASSSPSASPSPPPSPSPARLHMPSHFEIPLISRPTVESVEDDILEGTTGPLTAFAGLGIYTTRKMSGGSDKELPPRPESPEPMSPPSTESRLPHHLQYPPPPPLPVCPSSPLGSLDSPPTVTAPLRVRPRSRPPSTAEMSGDMITPASTRSPSGAEAPLALSAMESPRFAVLEEPPSLATLDGPPSLAALDRVLQILSPSTTGTSRTSSNSSLEKFKSSFPTLSPAITGASASSSGLSPTPPPTSLATRYIGLPPSSPSRLPPSPLAVPPPSPLADRPAPPKTPTRSATIPARPRPAHTAPSTPTHHRVRQGSLASFPSQASLRPGQDGFVSTMVSNINLRDTPESVRSARLDSDEGSVFSRYQ